MSDTPLAVLTQENTKLKEQLKNTIDQANGFVAQLDAHKQLLSENISKVLNLTAQLNVVTKMNNDFQAKLNVLQKLNDELVLKVNEKKGDENATDSQPK